MTHILHLNNKIPLNFTRSICTAIQHIYYQIAVLQLKLVKVQGYLTTGIYCVDFLPSNVNDSYKFSFVLSRLRVEALVACHIVSNRFHDNKQLLPMSNDLIKCSFAPMAFQFTRINKLKLQSKFDYFTFLKHLFKYTNKSWIIEESFL